MKIKYLICCIALSLLFNGAIFVFGQKNTNKKTVQTSNTVCFDPDKPCRHKSKNFDVWELSFKMPPKIRANKTYNSAPFYAVILKIFETDDECDGKYIKTAETERLKVQKKFSGRKVFASYNCPNMSSVDYDFDGKWNAAGDKLAVGNFIAVYAGAAKTEAEKVLQSVRKDYPKATLKRMTASYEQTVQ